MNRRNLFKRGLVVAAAVALGGKAGTAEAAVAKPQPYTPMDDSNIVYVTEQAIEDALNRQFGALSRDPTLPNARIVSSDRVVWEG